MKHTSADTRLHATEEEVAQWFEQQTAGTAGPREWVGGGGWGGGTGHLATCGAAAAVPAGHLRYCCCQLATCGVAAAARY